jgi:hypothetical protein
LLSRGSVGALTPVSHAKSLGCFDNRHPHFAKEVEAELLHLVVGAHELEIHPVAEVLVGDLGRDVSDFVAGPRDRLPKRGRVREAISAELRFPVLGGKVR